MVYDGHSGILPCKSSGDLRCVIRRCIVNNQDTYIQARLVQDALHALAEEPTISIAGYHYINSGQRSLLPRLTERTRSGSLGAMQFL